MKFLPEHHTNIVAKKTKEISLSVIIAEGCRLQSNASVSSSQADNIHVFKWFQVKRTINFGKNYKIRCFKLQIAISIFIMNFNKLNQFKIAFLYNLSYRFIIHFVTSLCLITPFSVQFGVSPLFPLSNSWIIYMCIDIYD